MKILDSQGRLFGKLSLLDLGAALIILAVVVGIFIFPGTSRSVAQSGEIKQVEVEVIVRGLSVLDPEALVGELAGAQKTELIVRKASCGEVKIKSVKQLVRQVIVPQPDGSVKALPDPRQPDKSFSVDLRLTFADKARIAKDGAVLVDCEKVKIGTPIEVEGLTYNFKGSVMGVRY